MVRLLRAQFRRPSQNARAPPPTKKRLCPVAHGDHSKGALGALGFQLHYLTAGCPLSRVFRLVLLVLADVNDRRHAAALNLDQLALGVVAEQQLACVWPAHVAEGVSPPPPLPRKPHHLGLADRLLPYARSYRILPRLPRQYRRHRRVDLVR